MGLRSESDRRSVENERERFDRECATPKDDWEGNEEAYIWHLYNGFTFSRDKYGNLVKLRGEEAVREDLKDHLDDKECCSYHQAIHQGYRDWMLAVRKKFEKMCKKGKFPPVDYAQKEREENEFWDRYRSTRR